MALKNIAAIQRARHRAPTALRVTDGDLRAKRIAGSVRIEQGELRLASLTIEVKPTESEQSSD